MKNVTVKINEYKAENSVENSYEKVKIIVDFFVYLIDNN